MTRRATMIGLVAALLGALPAGPAPAQTQRPNPSFNLVNRTDTTINEVYATPAGMTTWGRDRLGNNAIRPGASYPIRLPADGNCIYDVQVVFAGGAKQEQRRVNTCTIEDVVFGAAARTGAADPSFRLVNRARLGVDQVYATPVGVTTWGTDRLGNDMIPPGANHVIRLPRDAGCVFDVRLVYTDGSAIERRKLNLCQATDLALP